MLVKKIWKVFLTLAVSLGITTTLTACNPDLTADTHDCGYGFYTFENSAPHGLEQLSDKPHEIEAAMERWASDHAVPTFYTYHLLSNYTLKSDFQIGKNVYVGICLNSYTLTYDGYDAVTKDKDWGGFYTYECFSHTCYHFIDEAMGLSAGYLEFAYLYQNQNALVEWSQLIANQQGSGDSSLESGAAVETDGDETLSDFPTSAPVTLKPLLLPAGTYVIEDGVDYTAVIGGENPLVKLVSPAQTNICFNNSVTEDNKVMFEQTAEFFRKAGATVSYTCEELNPDPLTAVHDCPMMPVDNEMGLTQASFESVLEQMFAPAQTVSEEGDGTEVPESPEAPETEEPIQPTFLYAYLRQDIVWKETIVLPENTVVVVCTNGYEFNVKCEGEIYVFDCSNHVCVECGLEECYGVEQAAVDSLAAYSKAFMKTAIIPMKSGNYALMEDVDFTKVTLYLSADTEVVICTNGFEMSVNETSLSVQEGATYHQTNCTELSENSIINLERHACSCVAPHITAVAIGADGFDPYLDEQRRLNFPRGTEIAAYLTEDTYLPTDIIIPHQVKLTLCLNGKMLYSMQSEKEDTIFPAMFFVEYAAELVICDCSKEQTGAVFASVADSLDKVTSNKFEYFTAVVNMGTFTLDGGNIYSTIGVLNFGTFNMKRGGVHGLLLGVASATYDMGSLAPKKANLDLSDGVVSGAYAAIFTASGDASLQDMTIYAVGSAVVFYPSAGKNTIGDVDINMGLSGLGIVDIVLSLLPEDQRPTDDQIREVLVSSAQDMLEDFNGSAAALIVGSNATVTGDISLNIEKDLLLPINKGNGETLQMSMSGILYYNENAVVNFEDGVELSSELVLSIPGEEQVVANRDANLKAADGYTFVYNGYGDLVMMTQERADALFATATAQSFAMDINGYLELTFACEFAEKFYTESEGYVYLTIGDNETQLFSVKDAVMKNGVYQMVATVRLMAHEYNDEIRLEFYNGNYVWKSTPVMMDIYLGGVAVGETPVTLKAYFEQAITFATEQVVEQTARYAEIATAIAEKAVNEETGEPLYTAEDLSEQEQIVENCKALLDLALTAANYCNASAVLFGEETAYDFADLMLSSEATIAESQAMIQDVMTSDVEEIAALKPTLDPNSQQVDGVSFTGATLMLDAGTRMRFYFYVENGNVDDYTFAVNGQTVVPVKAKAENTWLVEIGAETGLAISELAESFKISVSGKSAGGEDVTYAFNYSVAGYAYTVLNNPNASAELKATMQALCLYVLTAQGAFTGGES